MNMFSVNCRVCQNPKLTPIVRTRDRLITSENVSVSDRDYHVGWCNECQCGTTEIVPDDKYFGWAYPEEYYKQILSVDCPVDRNQQFRSVTSLGDLKDLHILEIGCSSGDLLCLLRDRGAVVSGVEPSDISRTIAVNRGLNVVSALEQVRHGSFNIVILFDVLEHLPEPVDTFRWIADRLVKGGCVVVGVPNIACMEFKLIGKRWFPLELPRHLTHFTPKALERLGRLAGLKCERVETSKDSFFMKSFIDPRLKDSLLADFYSRLPGDSFVSRLMRISLRYMEKLLCLLGNRPYVTAFLFAR